MISGQVTCPRSHRYHVVEWNLGGILSAKQKSYSQKKSQDSGKHTHSHTQFGIPDSPSSNVFTLKNPQNTASSQLSSSGQWGRWFCFYSSLPSEEEIFPFLEGPALAFPHPVSSPRRQHPGTKLPSALHTCGLSPEGTTGRKAPVLGLSHSWLSSLLPSPPATHQPQPKKTPPL